MQAQSFDGVIHDFPDNIDPAVMNRVMKDYTLKNRPAQPETPAPAEDEAAESPSHYAARRAFRAYEPADLTDAEIAAQPHEPIYPAPGPFLDRINQARGPAQPTPTQSAPSGPSPEVWPEERPAPIAPTPAAQVHPSAPWQTSPTETLPEPPTGAAALPGPLGRVAGAVKEGWEGAAPILAPQAEQWLRDKGAGDNTIALINSPSLLMGALGAGFKGFQQGVQEVLTPIIGEQGARDFAAMPEAFMGDSHAMLSQRTALHDVAAGRIEPPGYKGNFGAYEKPFQAGMPQYPDLLSGAYARAYPVPQDTTGLTGPSTPPRQAGPRRPATPEQAAAEEATPAPQESTPAPAATVAPNAPPGTTPVPAEAALAQLAAPEARTLPTGQAPSPAVAPIQMPGGRPALAAPEAAPEPRVPSPQLPSPPAAPIALGGPEPEQQIPATPVAQPVHSQENYTLQQFSPNDLTLAPKVFQYKEADERGVTGALSGAKRWESDLADPITVYQTLDGTNYVVNGHQRTDLALRAQEAGQPNITMPAKVYREADGYTPEAMLYLGAYQNIAQGSGTAIDAAKIMRAAPNIPPGMRLPDLNPQQQLVKQGRGLANLSDEVFGAVANGVIPGSYAAHIGEMISDPAQQMGALKALVQAQPSNPEQARLMVRDIIDSGYAKQLADNQGDLLGDEPEITPLFGERGRVLEGAMKNLRGAKSTFNAAIKGESTLTAAGNQLSTEANEKAKTDNAQLLDIINRNGTKRGPISDALNVAAQELRDGKALPAIISKFLAQTRAIVGRGEGENVRGSDLSGGTDHPGAGEAEPPVAGQEGFFAGKSLAGEAEWKALLARGAEVKRMATAYAEQGKPAKFLGSQGITYVVSKDLNYPPDGWRVTMFGKDGTPLGHWEAKNAYEAFREVLAGKRELIGPNHLAEGFSEDRVPLFSPTERAVDGLKQAKGTGEQMLAQIMKTPGVKPEELNWLNLPNWLRGQKSVTRDQIADYVRANNLDVREVTRGGDRPEQFVVSSAGGPMATNRGSMRFNTRAEAESELASREREIPQGFHNIAEMPEQGTQTKFGSYTLPGGENYREMLITLPPKHEGRLAELDAEATRLEAAGDPRWREVSAERAKLLKETTPYRSSHWDEPNVLAHLRFNERTAPDGKRVLFVEEVQSDWHQAGRKQGYKGDFGPPQWMSGTWDGFRKWAEGKGYSDAELESAWDTSGERDQPRHSRDIIDAWDKDRAVASNAEEARSRAVPDAPFKTTWPSLVMKRAIKFAVDNGFDRIAWAPGEVHAERYDLSKQIEALDYQKNPDGTYKLSYQHHGRGHMIGEDIPEAKLEDHIGKDVAKRIVDGEGKPTNFAGNNDKPNVYHRLSGLDLKVGGEGMAGFYDRILPAETNKIVGKYGAKVGKSEVAVPHKERGQVQPDAQAIKDHSPAWDAVVAKLQPLHEANLNRTLDAAGEKRMYELQDDLDRIHERMVDDTMSRGQMQPVHSVDITPALRNVVSTQGLGLFAGKRLPAPPPSGTDLFGATRAPPATRTPEPTIRNDQRQAVMPGMEPSAVQAQAAHDAAGPRTGQEPANQGLFARPETPQPELTARRVSQWAHTQVPEFVDELHLIPDLNSGQAGAANWVFEQGRKTGFEHLAVVENATGRIVHAGTARSKDFVPFKSADVLDVWDAYTFHHNHPNGSALSGGDISMLGTPGIAHVVAHGANGETYSASLNRMKGDLRDSNVSATGRMQRELENKFKVEKESIGRILTDMIKRGEVSYPEADVAYGDMVNRVMAAEGLTHYVSTYELPKVLADKLASILRTRNHAPEVIDQSAQYIRPSERTAGLPAPNGSRPVQRLPGSETGDSRGPPQSRAPAVDAAAPTGTQGRLLEGLEAGPQLPLGGGPNADVLADKTGLPRLMLEVKSAFSPTAIKGAQPMELAIRKHGAEAAVAYQRAVESLRKVREATDRLPVADQIDFTDRMERGLAQRDPKLQQVANTLRTILDDWTQQIQSMGKGYLEHAIEDYMGHVWGNYREWAAGQPNAHPSVGMGQAQAAAQGKRPLEGSKAFLKKRSFPYQTDGIAAGLRPVTYNPIDLQLLKLREMQKFYYGQRLADAMKNTGMATWVRHADQIEAERRGYVKLDDRVFQPMIVGAHAAGPVVPGAYYAIEPQARLFNRYMSQGIAGKSLWYDMARAAGNALNSIQLAWPGFHTSFVTTDTANSRFALGLQQMANGQVIKGMGSVATGAGGLAAPGAVVRSLVTGTKLRKAVLDPASADPMYRQLADDFLLGGARLGMDRFYNSSATGSFIHGWKDFDPRHIANEIAQMYRDTPPGWRKLVVPPI